MTWTDHDEYDRCDNAHCHENRSVMPIKNLDERGDDLEFTPSGFWIHCIEFDLLWVVLCNHPIVVDHWQHLAMVAGSRFVET